jgi:hypothetical protein
MEVLGTHDMIAHAPNSREPRGLHDVIKDWNSTQLCKIRGSVVEHWELGANTYDLGPEFEPSDSHLSVVVIF